MKNYGNPPKVVGEFNPDFSEMCAYLYLPISLLGSDSYMLPERLKPFWALINASFKDYNDLKSPYSWKDCTIEKYVYLSVKNLWVTPESPGNRPGWHVDGWGSDGDVTYIWSDKNATEFSIQDFINIPDDDTMSMIEISKQVKDITTYDDRSLLRIDESVVHRVGAVSHTGMRCFFKLSISDHKYDMIGNSHNYLLDYDWNLSPRGVDRNIDISTPTPKDI